MTNEELENENFIYYNSKIISRYIMESDYEEAERADLFSKAVKSAFNIDGRKIDEIKLYLYFLDAATAKEVPFDEEKTTEKIEDMGNVLCKDFNKLSTDFYPKAEGEQCEKCDYKSVCLQQNLNKE